MRPGMNNNNNKRPRGRHNNNHSNHSGGGNGGGGQPQQQSGQRGQRSAMQMRHQSFDSNGPDIRVRGTAIQVYEKYQSLARDASSNGDRVLSESYLQHAEHYYRIVEAINSAIAAEQARMQVQRPAGFSDQPDMGGPNGGDQPGQPQPLSADGGALGQTDGAVATSRAFASGGQTAPITSLAPQDGDAARAEGDARAIL